ncbi:endonuclease/exonuclease/phosphatase family protein [Acuticoccus sp. M5D2P5]|uniref:endonuclease/exonuclease/phosphatase family protein n=1 Tax=Acuticoccus kalidii TaxID=2910977 RepID=UPI001F27D489|nr:endonuclease/exonuclease/phosphatase family protein [Acuticoccus kalidii]MCF3934889.1 endonuclease/exonuclease/phosphatase family protein [Acuticoccus kalidii]
MRIATFNVQNMRLRADGHLDGARDEDVPADRRTATAFDALDRRLTAAVLKEADADIVALQEVFDQATLDYFHDTVLVPAGVAPYPHRICRPGNDGRGLDVALMSRVRIDRSVSHADATPASLGLDAIAEVGAEERVFRRDCLEVTAGSLTLFVCHLKAPYPDPDIAWRLRRLEASAVRRLVERRFPDAAAALWLILGDLNETVERQAGNGPAIAPILGNFSADLMLRLPERERWSYHQPPAHPFGRPDGFFASPALARRWPTAVPRVIRLGLGGAEGGFIGAGGGAGWHHPHASDHAALVIDLEGL